MRKTKTSWLVILSVIASVLAVIACAVLLNWFADKPIVQIPRRYRELVLYCTTPIEIVMIISSLIISIKCVVSTAKTGGKGKTFGLIGIGTSMLLILVWLCLGLFVILFSGPYETPPTMNPNVHIVNEQSVTGSVVYQDPYSTPTPTCTPIPVSTLTPTPTAIPESLSLQEQDLSSYVADIGGSSVYHVPQLLIEGEYASQVNAEILGIYAGYAQEQDRHYTGSEYIAFLSDGGCLSLVFVEQGIWDDDVYHVYNIDVNTGSRVTNEQIAEMAGVTDIGQAAEDAVLQYIDMYLPSPMLDEQMEYTLSEENLNADMMIGLTSESEMFFVSEVGSLGGASYYYEIYDEDGNDLLHLDFWVAW